MKLRKNDRRFRRHVSGSPPYSPSSGNSPGCRSLCGQGKYCWCSARFGLDSTELRVSTLMGPPPPPGSSYSTVAALYCLGPEDWPAFHSAAEPRSLPDPIDGPDSRRVLPIKLTATRGSQRLERSGWQDARRGMLDVARRSREIAGAGSSVNR